MTKEDFMSIIELLEEEGDGFGFVLEENTKKAIVS